MNGPNKKKVESLSEWLEIATKDLVPAAKERIAQEIETHFADAVETHLKLGEQELVARFKAVAELGDAGVAGKRFRRKHLTEKEAKRLARAQKDVGRFPWLVFTYLMFAFFCYLVLPAADSFPKWSKLHLFLFIAGSVLFGAILPTIAFLIVRGHWFRRRVSSFALVQSLGCGEIAFVIALMATTRSNFLTFAAICILKQLSWLRIWNKVRKTRDDESGVPKPA
jgi:hypothetical protein